MADDWTIDRFLTFALGLSTLDTLSPATIEQLGEGLVWLAQEQASIEARYQGVIASQNTTIARQSVTIEMQAGTIERLSGALRQLRPGVLLLDDEEDAP
jgi:hypothetical protein